MFKQYLEKLDSLTPLVKVVNDEEVSVLLKFLYDRIQNPDSYLVFLGETSSGKSSIINGLFNETILPVKASPSTGTITEVELKSDDSSDEYIAINKDASFERINRKVFCQLVENPDSNLLRLKLRKHLDNSDLNNLRIFDTPGYGSIVKEHEEILKDFLPNSDVVVYTVGYKIGIQDEDYSFMGFLKQLVREDVKIILLVNRCPVGMSSNNSRLSEVVKYAKSLLSIDTEVICIENTEVKEGELYALPQSRKLWEVIGQTINSDDRIEYMGKAFDSYIKELYSKCASIINSQYISQKLDKDSLEECINEQRETARRIRQAIPELIEPAFDKIISVLPSRLEKVALEVNNQVQPIIDGADQNLKSKEATSAYIQSFVVPNAIKQEVRNNVQDYIETVIKDLNERVDDYINGVTVDFNNQINIIINTNTELAARNLGGKVCKEAAVNGLKHYFAQMGGAAGANGGIANAASHLLKQAGDLFGKTFQLSTHNALKTFLSKIGATSMRTIGAIIAVVIEGCFIIYDIKTWQSKLKKGVDKGLKEWLNESLPEVEKDLLKLKQENINTINEIADDFDKSVAEFPTLDLAALEKAMEMSDEVGKKLGYI